MVLIVFKDNALLLASINKVEAPRGALTVTQVLFVDIRKVRLLSIV